MNPLFTTEQLAKSLHVIFSSTNETNIQSEINSNEECQKPLNIFIKIAKNNTRPLVLEKFSTFKNRPELQKLNFFKKEDLENWVNLENIANKHLNPKEAKTNISKSKHFDEVLKNMDFQTDLGLLQALKLFNEKNSQKNGIINKKKSNRLLIIAIKLNFIESAKYLIDQQVPLICPNHSEDDPLTLMFLNNRTEMFKYAIEKRIFPEFKIANNTNNKDLLKRFYGLAYLFVIHNQKEYIEELKKNPYAQKIFNRFPFLVEFSQLAKKGDINRLITLQNDFKAPLVEPNIEKWDSSKCTLIAALESNQNITAEELIKLGIKYNDIDNDGSTRLHYFIKTHNSRAAAFLLNQEQININIKDHQGRTPLILALEMNDFDMATQLIEKDPSVLSEPEKLKAYLIRVINMNNWDAFTYTMKFGSKYYKLWKSEFESISLEIPHQTHKLFVMKSVLKFFRLLAKAFRLKDKNHIVSMKSQFWQNKLTQILNETPSIKNQELIIRQLNECRDFIQTIETSFLYRKQVKLEIKNKKQKIDGLNTNLQKKTNKILEKYKQKIFEQESLESLQTLNEKTKTKIENEEQNQIEQIQELLTSQQKKESSSQEDEYKQKFLEQQKELEELKKKLTQSLEREKSLQERNEILEQKTENLLKKERFLKTQNKHQKKKIINLSNIINNKNSQNKGSAILEKTSTDINNSQKIEEPICKFIEPKNNSLTSLINCIEVNCDLLIEQKKTDLDFANIKNRAMGSLKTREELENLCSAAGFLRPSNSSGGSHAKWKCVYIDIDSAILSTHEGDDNDEGRKKSVLETVLKVLKKQF